MMGVVVPDQTGPPCHEVVQAHDALAHRGNETIYAEVKGRTKSRPGAGLDTLYGQLLRRMPVEEVGDPNTRFAVVIPTGAEAAALRNALAAGLLTVAVLGDEPDSALRLFDVVGPHEEPVPDQSVRMLWLDAERLLVEDIDLVAYARFEGLVGQFSSYMLVMIPEPGGGALLVSAMAGTMLLRPRRHRLRLA
jgi:hypothetical protein